MKKKLLFLIPMIIVAVLLFMLRATGMTAHIAVSVVGLVLLIAYTVATKKEWKNPALEILQRVFYAVALITGVVIMNVHGLAVLSIIHKASAVLFMALMIVLLITKKIKSER